MCLLLSDLTFFLRTLTWLSLLFLKHLFLRIPFLKKFFPPCLFVQTMIDHDDFLPSALFPRWCFCPSFLSVRFFGSGPQRYAQNAAYPETTYRLFLKEMSLFLSVSAAEESAAGCSLPALAQPPRFFVITAGCAEVKQELVERHRFVRHFPLNFSGTRGRHKSQPIRNHRRRFGGVGLFFYFTKDVNNVLIVHSYKNVHCLLRLHACQIRRNLSDVYFSIIVLFYCIVECFFAFILRIFAVFQFFCNFFIL